MNKHLMQEDLWTDNLDFELLDRKRYGFNRTELNILLARYAAGGGQVTKLAIGDNLLYGAKKHLNPYPWKHTDDNPANRFNLWFRAKDGSNVSRQKREKIK